MATRKLKREAVPSSAQRLYRMCWQLESWLRLFLYVELRAERIDWERPIEKSVNGWPPNSLKNDKRLHHMSTPHQDAISYLTLTELWKVISTPQNWPLFERYFPPRELTAGKFEEVKAIRNRVAHFRDPHPTDISRLELFLRDMDPGVRRFCSRYAVPKQSRNPDDGLVFASLKSNWETTGYGIELSYGNAWLYAPGVHRMQPLMNASVDLLPRGDHEPGSLKGLIFSLYIHGKSGHLDAAEFYNQTKALHGHVIHIKLSQMTNELTVTIPGIHGVERTTELIRLFLSAGLECSRRMMPRILNRQELEWPEYVLWPDHLLTFYSDEIQQPVLETK